MNQQYTKELTVDELVEGFRNLGLSNTDTVLVQSSFKAFGVVVGGPRTVIEALLEVLHPNGTLIMPAFNWSDFGENKLYSKCNTKPQTGILSTMLTSWNGCHRIYHPIHGFSLVGKGAEKLSKKIKNESSFEDSSLFGELHRMNAKLMMLGINYNIGLTYFHYIEESVGVPYRKFIKLQGKVEELDGSVHGIAIKYYGRNTMKLQYNIDHIEPFLENSEGSVVAVNQIGGSTVKLMNARDVYDRVAVALRNDPNLVLVK